MIPKKSSSKRSKKKSLQTKLWKLVSQYIRTRDTYEKGDNRIGQCFTCGTIKDYRELDAGHFIPKTSKRFMYDERNIHAQCQKCNRFQSGNIHEYFVAMEKKYGRDIVNELLESKGQIHKFTDQDLEDLIQEYIDKLDNIS